MLSDVSRAEVSVQVGQTWVCAPSHICGWPLGMAGADLWGAAPSFPGSCFCEMLIGRGAAFPETNQFV